MNQMEEKRSALSTTDKVFLALCVLLFGLIFQPYVGKLVELWMSKANTAYSHGPLIPFVILYLLWDKRDRLKGLTVRPSWKGGGTAFLISILIWLVSVGGRSRFAVEMGMVFLIISFVWMNFGSVVMKEISFPLFLLFLMVPIPAILYADISQTLQLWSSKMSVAFLHLAGVPVFRQGNIINLPNTQLQVATACSGISSLLSLFTLALIFGYISQSSFLRRTVIALSSLFIAVFMNWLRISLTSLITYYWTDKIAQGFYHSFSGWLVFVAAFAILLGENAVINKFRKKHA